MSNFDLSIDNEGRCKHYHGKKDTTLIKFKCCEKYYPCYKCHLENESHSIELWKKEDFNEKGILCGVCNNELTINDYLKNETCYYCNASFNPNCSKHYDQYFDIDSETIKSSCCID